jgi:hypothetical protein
MSSTTKHRARTLGSCFRQSTEGEPEPALSATERLCVAGEQGTDGTPQA